MTESFPVGAVKTIDVTFTDAAGVLADPTTVTFEMLDPDDVRTTYVHQTDAQLVKDSTGKYHVDWPLAKPGRHRWTWKGAGIGSGEGAVVLGELYALWQEA